jgi:hypothetical protein
VSKHTPGPWTAFRHEGTPGRHLPGWHINEAGGPGYVCSVECYEHRAEQCEANARLIGAAPDMLQALRRAVLALAFAAETFPAMRDDYEAVSNAIDKATGENT